MPARKKRGRETALDMLRSLALVLIPVVVLWFFARPPSSDEQRVREVDQAPAVDAWEQRVPGAPIATAPSGWTPTVADVRDGSLRLGWLTDDDRYAEFSATTEGGEPFVQDVVGDADEQPAVEIDGVAWRHFVEADGSITFVREVGGVTVAVGTKRATADDEALRALAASVAG